MTPAQTQQDLFVTQFNEWAAATGALPKGGSWYFELLSMFERADALKAAQIQQVIEMLEREGYILCKKEPVGYWFSDAPEVCAYPGSGYFPGAIPPNDAINITPLYSAAPAYTPRSKMRGEKGGE